MRALLGGRYGATGVGGVADDRTRRDRGAGPRPDAADARPRDIYRNLQSDFSCTKDRPRMYTPTATGTLITVGL